MSDNLNLIRGVSQTCNQNMRELRRKMLGFYPQKEKLSNHYLPYAQQLDEECVEYLSKIKANIPRSLILSDWNELTGFSWINDLDNYISLYGLCFSKSDHIYFIQLLFNVITIPDLYFGEIMTYAKILIKLLKKKELISPKELSVPWRPLYKLYRRTNHSKHKDLKMITIPVDYDTVINELIKLCRVYFPIESTQEMLDEWRPLLCPYDLVMYDAMEYFRLFLPTLSLPENHDKGFKLWFKEFMTIWESIKNNPPWEWRMVSLLSRLASDTIGFIDWNPYIPMIFTRLIRGFKNRNYAHSDVVVWIVSMLSPNNLCQKYLTQLIKSNQTYYYPSNHREFTDRLQFIMRLFTTEFIDRLHRERYKENSWLPAIPDSYKLNEENMTNFINSLIEIVIISMFSPLGSSDSEASLRNLVQLRPDIVIPKVLKELSESLDIITEPHRLEVSINCLTAILPSIINNRKSYPEYTIDLLPLLTRLLVGLDINDIEKLKAIFNLIETFAYLVPLTDCSSEEKKDLTENEIELCLSTAGFEDFVLVFIDRCLELIENSSDIDNYHLDQEDRISMADEELAVCSGIKNVLSRVLSRSSPQIFEMCLNKIFSFVSNHVLASPMNLRTLLTICAGINPKLTLQKFMPHYCDKVLEMTENNDISKEDKVDKQLSHTLKFIRGLIHCDGSYLIEYRNLIIEILDRTLNFKCIDIYNISSIILEDLLKCLTSIYELEFINDSENSGNSNITDWAKTYNLSEVNLKWHIPNDEEIDFAKLLLEKYLFEKLNELRSWTENKIRLTNEELQRTLYIVDGCILGASNVLPIWEGMDLNLSNSLILMSNFSAKCFGSKSISFANNENIRELVVKTTHLVLEHVMAVCEDNTNSLHLLIRLYRMALFDYGLNKTDYLSNKNNYNHLKQKFKDKLLTNKRYIRSVHVKRLIAQHQLRVSFENNQKFTELHKTIINDLLLLSTSHYSGIRLLAQNELFNCFKRFPYCHRLLLPDILKLLNKMSNANDEQLEGTLFLIGDYYGSKNFSIMTDSDCISMSESLVTLVNSKPSEMPKIIELLEHIAHQIRQRFYTYAIFLDIPDSCIECAKKIWTQNESHPKPAFECPSDEEICEASEKAKMRNETNISAYNLMIEKIVVLIDDEKLHWRYNDLAFDLLKVLIRPDISYPISAIKLWTKGLINEKESIRKLAIDSFVALLETIKNPNTKHELKPLPTNNQWLQTDLEYDSDNEQLHNSTNFVDKPHRGFYCYEKPFLVYDKRDLKTKTEFSERELFIYDIFSNNEFVDKLLTHLTQEEDKGAESFKHSRFRLWNGLFKLFGPFNSKILLPKLKKYIEGDEDCQHRCAAEIMGGLIRGSKHWSFDQLFEIRELLKPLITHVFNNITTETDGIWSLFTIHIFGDRDPKRMLWVFRIYFEDPLEEGSDSKSSFRQYSKLLLLRAAFGEFEWKCLKISKKLLEYFETKHLNHIYQDIRSSIGGLLYFIFKCDDNMLCLPNTLLLAPKRSQFVDRVLPRLQILLNTEETQNSIHFDANNERKDAINILKTICIWIDRTTSNSPICSPPELFKFVPILCLMGNDSNDEELSDLTLNALHSLTSSTLSNESIEIAINTIKEVSLSPNWHSRQTAAGLILTLVSANLFTLMSNQLWIEDLTQLVLSLLKDKMIEVRETAQNTLNSLMHCEFIEINNELINGFKLDSNSVIKKSKQQNGLKCLKTEYMSLRHSGILGLCSIINSNPYSVPHFIPDIMLFLTEHLNDPQPIPSTIRKTLSDFKRTHFDNWREHKLKFTEYQLDIISDLLVSPSYYA